MREVSKECWYTGDLPPGLPSETIGMIEVGSRLAGPQVDQRNLLPESVMMSSVITLGVSGFAAKWMFAQIIHYWQQQFKDLKKDLDELKGDISALSTKDEEIRIDLSKLKIDIAQEYVSREDWIRSSVGLENKLERLGLRIDDKFERLMERLPLTKSWDKN